MFVGSAYLECNANPLTGYILGPFGPFVGRQKTCKNGDFDTQMARNSQLQAR